MSQFHDCAQIPLPSVDVFPTKSIPQTVLGWLRNTDRRLGVDIHKADQAFMRKNKSKKKYPAMHWTDKIDLIVMSRRCNARQVSRQSTYIKGA